MNAYGRYTVRWIVIAVALIAVLAIGWATLVSPALLDADAKNRRESHQYTETQRSFLLQKLSACQQLEGDIAALPDGDAKSGKRAQLKAFVAEMRQRVALIDASEVPAPVSAYLESK